MSEASYSSFVTNPLFVEDDEKHGGVDDAECAGKYYDKHCARVAKRKIACLEQKAAARDTDLRINVQQWRDFLWKPNADIEAKVDFVLCFGHVTASTDPTSIALYLLTLYDMTQPKTLQTMIELLFATNASEVDQTIRNNLHACSMIDPQLFVNTPLHNYEFYKQLVGKLSFAHAEHVRYATHFRAAMQSYTSNRPMEPLLSGPNAPPPPEPAPRDEDGSQRALLDKKPWQLLFEFLLVQANAQGMRRLSQTVYRPVYSDKTFTRFYVRHSDMSAWIYDQVNAHDYPAHYDALTKDEKTMKYLLYHLKAIPDVRFPFLRPCRTLFSYENGIFNADECKFYPYICPLVLDSRSRLGDISKLPDDVGTAQYFEGVTLPISWFTRPDFDWAHEIQTTNINKVFEDQGYNEIELAWVRAFHGRGLHDIIARHEDWQIIVHTKGPAGCGKSVIGKVLKSWFPKERFGVLNDDMQENFPDGHLKDSWAVVCFDASPDFALSPTRFLCWASGDDVTIHQKFKDTISQPWTTPVFFFSNYEIPVQGGSGSAIRRALTISLEQGVRVADGQLLNNALKESGFYLVKCTFDYHEKCRLFGKVGLWDNPKTLPERFWRAREQFAKASSWQDAFLLSGRFSFGTDFELPVDAFKCEYANFQQVQKALPGVNRSRKYGRSETRVPPCQPSEFANALRSIRQGACYWDTTRNVIVGLTLALEPEPQQAVAAPIVPRLTMSQQRNKRPRDATEPYTQPKTPRIDIDEPIF